jgi:hypothetical protein
LKYLLVEPLLRFAKAPNIALMKFARWCQQNGHDFRYVRGKVKLEDFAPDEMLISLIFSYYSELYDETIEYYRTHYNSLKKITAGGVFPTLHTDWFKRPKWEPTKRIFTSLKPQVTVEPFCGMDDRIEDIVPMYNVPIISEDTLPYKRDRIVMYASRGCTNKCGYCAVPKLEGGMRSFTTIKKSLEAAAEDLPDAKSVVLYDNNFTAHEHIEDIVSELVDFGKPVDIHGLHVQEFDERIAKQFERLKWASQSDGTAYLRFSFDWLKYTKHVECAYKIYSDHDIKAGFFCYMLFNWIDSPSDFWKRLVLAQEFVGDTGKPIWMFPQRYEPFMSLTRNSYVGKKWNPKLIRGVTRLYTFLHGFIPLTNTRNIFRWLGYSEDEFIERAYQMGTNKNYRLKKKKGDIPKIK